MSLDMVACVNVVQTATSVVALDTDGSRYRLHRYGKWIACCHFYQTLWIVGPSQHNITLHITQSHDASAASPGLVGQRVSGLYTTTASQGPSTYRFRNILHGSTPCCLPVVHAGMQSCTSHPVLLGKPTALIWCKCTPRYQLMRC